MSVRAGIIVGLLAAACHLGTAASAAGQVPCALPPSPTALMATVSGIWVVVTWTASPGPPVRYVLEAGTATHTSNVAVVDIDAGVTEYTSTTPVGTYFVRVRGRNACGVSQPSAEITVVSGVYQTHPDVLVTPKTADRNTYFPSVAKTGDGRLLVAYYDSPEHVSPRGRISMVESRDNGRTWSRPRVIIDTPLDDRDPSLTVTRAGRVLVSYFARDTETSRSAGVFVVRSDDGGATWSDPVRVDTILTDSATTSKIVEAENGDLLIPLYGSVAGDGHSRVTIGRSRDQGRTWPREQEIAVAAESDTNVMEPTLAIAGARMLVLMRTDRAENFAYATRSIDSGLTWSTPSSFGMAAQSSELVPLPGEPAVTAVHLWADWSHHWGDSRPTIAQMIRWPVGTAAPVFGEPRVLYNSKCDDAGYPSGVVLDDGRLFVVFYDACFGYIGGAYLRPATLP